MGEKNLVIKFDKPYVFEGKEYNEVDLSGINCMTGKDYRAVEEMVIAKGQTPILSEQTINGINAIAALASSLPIEFFEGLQFKAALAVRNTLFRYLGFLG